MAESPLYPPQDLARLVLGYLEEEECVSAYNEFIKSSPHLDMFRTNYDNAVMLNFSSKSLKDVFGEYCAFKAYTRNCKIPGLRTRLLQCKTLLDTAQLLIANTDVKKVQNQEDGPSRLSFTSAVPSQPSKRKQCDTCKTINGIDGCNCQLQQPTLPNYFATQYSMAPQEIAANFPMETLLETTQLADLPGTSDVAKRKSLSDNQLEHKTNARLQIHHMEMPATAVGSSGQSELQLRNLCDGPPCTSLPVKPSDLLDRSGGMNDILNIASQGRASANNKTINQITPVAYRSSTVSETKRRVSAVSRSLQDFASGSTGDSKCVPSEAMPDSSTPESNIAQTAQLPNTYDTGLVKIAALQPGISKHNQVNTSRLKCTGPGQTQNNLTFQTREQLSSETDGSRDSLVMSGNDNVHTDEPILTNQKLVSSSSAKTAARVRILSNDLLKTAGDEGAIILDKGNGTTTMLRALPGKPPGVKNFNLLPATNSIIQINGFPAYHAPAPSLSKPNDYVYTKEEIMAMPTVIVLQSPVTSLSSQTSSTNTNTAVNTTNVSLMQTDSDYRSLEPISMEVEPEPEITAEISTHQAVPNEPASMQSMYVPNGTIPKVTVSHEKVTSTPKNSLVVKKASSTPRRTSSSHVRVLDFTTPRRILPTQEVLEEDILSFPATTVATALKDNLAPVGKPKPQDTEIVKKTEIVRKSKADWDADLRAHLPLLPSLTELKKKKQKYKLKKKSPKKSKEGKNNDSQSDKKSKIIKRVAKKTDTAKKMKLIEVEDKEEPIKPSIIPIKPTINLIKDWREEPIVNSAKTDEGAEIVISGDTPENDGQSVMNPPTSASKHNLSDLFLLQTPYKMIMDNIQMETPRYIDASVFDGPISDIKIDSIPTPNFLMTGGKGLGGMGATPSSYSSRLTDYSSGGSYYRPDEHDYATLPDLQPTPHPHITSHIPCTSKMHSTKTPKNKIQRDENNIATISSRPRRRCTLKVSYCETPASKSEKESTKARNRESKSPSISSDTSHSFQSSDSTKGSASEGQSKKPCQGTIESKEEFFYELEKKRKRTIDNLKKKTPVKSTRKKRSRSSFPKVKITEKKIQSAKKIKTVTDLRQSIGPRKMANISKERFGKKSIGKDSSDLKTLPLTGIVPKKSRRKSSTPRKVDKNIVANLDDSVSVDTISHKQDVDDMVEDELPPLRVSSDDGSQDSRFKKMSKHEDTETDDIRQIKAYIETTSNTMEPTVQELVQRGFDLETAKSIERDLLGTPQRESGERNKNNSKETANIIVDLREEVDTSSDIVVTIERLPNQDPEVSSKSNLPSFIDPASSQETSEINSKVCLETIRASSEMSSMKNDSAIILEGDIVMVRQTFDEKSDNNFKYEYSEEQSNKTSKCARIDENFALNIECDDLSIRVCLGKHETLYDLAPREDTQNENVAREVLHVTHSSSSSSDSDHSDESVQETMNAVQSISNIEPLYSPIKLDHHTSMQRQCLEIFDSTLNSLDTPVKMSFSNSGDAFTPCDIEDQAREGWNFSSKRKNQSSTPVQESACKKNKPDHQILMQNIDIESFLTKLHGENT